MIEPGSFSATQPQRHRLRHEEGGAHVEIHDGVEVVDRDLGQTGFGRFMPALLTST